MLSSAKIGRSSWRYYQRTVAGGACEYYTEHGDRPGRWHGSGLSALGLKPDALVVEYELEALFGRALSPTTGQQLGAAWRPDAVTGFDLTFSAPKSVSALWALADPATARAVDVAHTAAVKAGLGYLEEHASFSRRGRDGIEQVVSLGFAAALFDHTTSRTGDPQLHTHALVVNKVRCADGSWRSLDGHEIYHHKKSAGAVYQSALRAELTRALPVAFGPVSEHGQAELLGVPDELMSVWSSRTTAVMGEAVPTIAAAEDALGRELTADERARVIKTAVLATRPVKDTTATAGEMRERWRDQALDLGWDGPCITAAVSAAGRAARGMDPKSLSGAGWQAAVMGDAVAAVGASKAIWSRADLVVQIAARLPVDDESTTTADEVTRLVELLAERALVDTTHGAVALGTDQAGVTPRASDDRYASQEVIDVEARILDRVITGGFQSPSRLPTWVTDLLFDAPFTTLSGEQRTAAVRLVASGDRVRVMTAPAGAGKTTTLAAAVRLWERCSRDVVTLAPSARAAAELSAATVTRGETVARWLHRQRLDEATAHDANGSREARGRLTSRSVVIVDEASMLTTADLDELTRRVDAVNAVLVLVGDPAQIGAVNAPGGMFELLTQKLGPWAVQLSELHRFTDPWEAAATLRLRAGDPDVLAEYAMRGRIHPAASSEDAADAAFGRWRDATDRGLDALMLARSWADVTALNARARAVAVATGAVTGPVLATITSSTPSTGGRPEERSWRAGDILLAKQNTTRIPIGTETLRNGDRFRVIAAATPTVGGQPGLVVEDLNGRGRTTLPAAYLARYAEYGWAATIDGAQGATADIGIVLARSGLDREHLYVAMSRGRDENHVHTTPELNTGDAGPHPSTPMRPPGSVEVSTPGSPQPPTQPRQPAPGPTQSLTQPPGPPAQPPAPLVGRVALALPQPVPGSLPSHAHRLPRPVSRADLEAAITRLTTAVTTSGRERAAHTLLDGPLQAARQRAWQQREDTRPPRPVPSEHQRHQQAFEQARAELEQARAIALDATEHRQRLEAQRAALPFWARSRREQLTARIEDPAETWRLHAAIKNVEHGERAVAAATRVVDTDTAQRASEDAADRARRHREWVRRGPWACPDLEPAVIRSSPADRRQSESKFYDYPRTVEPPSRGYGLSR